MVDNNQVVIWLHDIKCHTFFISLQYWHYEEDDIWQ